MLCLRLPLGCESYCRPLPPGLAKPLKLETTTFVFSRSVQERSKLHLVKLPRSRPSIFNSLEHGRLPSFHEKEPSGWISFFAPPPCVTMMILAG